MFIVYTPEGRNRIQPGELAPQLKVAQTKRVNPVGQSEMDQMHFEEAMAQVHEKTQPALKEYQSIQNKSERKPVVKVYEIMTQPVITIGEETSLGQAWQKMVESHVHHLPVVDEVGELVGLVSSHDILMRSVVGGNGQLDIGGEGLVTEVMTEQVVTTKAETDIRRVAQVMSEYNLGCIVIMSDAESIRGIVTLSDIVRRLSESPPLEIYV